MQGKHSNFINALKIGMKFHLFPPTKSNKILSRAISWINFCVPKYLGRFGVSGKMQARKMSELSDGQKSRVVLAKLGRDVPHILLLDEPTNHLGESSMSLLVDIAVLLLCVQHSTENY